MVYNSDLLFQENEGLRIDHSLLSTKYSVACTENSVLRTEIDALRSQQNICAACGNDPRSSTVSDQLHVIVLINCAFMCSVATEDVFF